MAPARLFHKSLSASCFSSSNRIQRSHVHDISPCLSHSAFLSHTAGTFRRTYIYTGIVASPCTSPRQRTGAPPHSNESVRPQALLHQAFLPPGGHAISACACHDHAHATASAVDLLPSTCACGVWLYNTWVVFRPRVNMNAREILRYKCIYNNKASSSHTTRTTHHA